MTDREMIPVQNYFGRDWQDFDVFVTPQEHLAASPINNFVAKVDIASKYEYNQFMGTFVLKYLTAPDCQQRVNRQSALATRL